VGGCDGGQHAAALPASPQPAIILTATYGRSRASLAALAPPGLPPLRLRDHRRHRGAPPRTWSLHARRTARGRQCKLGPQEHHGGAHDGGLAPTGQRGARLAIGGRCRSRAADWAACWGVGLPTSRPPHGTAQIFLMKSLRAGAAPACFRWSPTPRVGPSTLPAGTSAAIVACHTW